MKRLSYIQNARCLKVNKQLLTSIRGGPSASVMARAKNASPLKTAHYETSQYLVWGNCNYGNECLVSVESK